MSSVTGQEVLYYCESGEDGLLTIHRGGKEGSIIATANPCLVTEGQTDIHFTELNLTIPLKHKHHQLPSIHSKSSFSADNKSYHWKDHNELIQDETKEKVATFHSTWFEGAHHKIGSLDISQREIQDIVVITALIVQERSDEHSLTVNLLFKLSDFQAELAREQAMKAARVNF